MKKHVFPIARLASGLPSPQLHAVRGTFTRNPRIDFHSRFWINFNSTALLQNAFLGLDLAAKPFGGDFEQLSPRKMTKHMFPIARLASGLPSPQLQAVPPFPRQEPKN